MDKKSVHLLFANIEMELLLIDCLRVGPVNKKHWKLSVSRIYQLVWHLQWLRGNTKRSYVQYRVLGCANRKSSIESVMINDDHRHKWFGRSLLWVSEFQHNPILESDEDIRVSFPLLY